MCGGCVWAHAVDAAEWRGFDRIEPGGAQALAYTADAREAVVPPAPPAVGLDLGVERRGGVERDSIEAPRVGASQPAVVGNDGFISPDVCQTNGPFWRRVRPPPEVAPLDERRSERRPLRDGAEREARRPPRLLAARGQRRRAWRDSYDRGEAPAHLYTTYFVISRRRRGVQAKSAWESSAAWFGSKVPRPRFEALQPEV